MKTKKKFRTIAEAPRNLTQLHHGSAWHHCPCGQLLGQTMAGASPPACGSSFPETLPQAMAPSPAPAGCLKSTITVSPTMSSSTNWCSRSRATNGRSRFFSLWCSSSSSVKRVPRLSRKGHLGVSSCSFWSLRKFRVPWNCCRMSDDRCVTTETSPL